MSFTDQELQENHASQAERNAYYRTFGFDIDRSVEFVLSRAMPLDGRILEIGSGKGRFLTELARRVPKVTTIDLDAAEQRFAKMSAAYAGVSANIEFVGGDAAHLPWEAATFDTVVSMNALHHIQNLDAALDEALRVARPSGKIVLSDFTEEGFEVMDRLHAAEGRAHTRIRYDCRHVADRLASAGWNVAEDVGGLQRVQVARRAWSGIRSAPNRKHD